MLRKLGRRLLSSVSTFAILGVMVALAVWGHHSHWTLPKFSALLGEEKAPAAETADPTLLTSAGDEFPTIAFENEDAVTQNGVEVATASTRSLDEHVTANAVVGYNELRLAQLSPRVPGHVWAVRTHLGQTVKQGDVLALIDAEEVGRAKADFLQETATALHRSWHLERLKDALGSAISERAVREAEAAYKEARIRRFNAQQRLLNLGLKFDLDEKAAESPETLAGQIQFLGLPPGVVAEMKPRPATANLLPLIAPFDGTVIKQDMVAGEMVRPDTPQLVLADVATMWVRLSVRQEDASRLDLGQPVEFRAAGLSESVTGRLTWVSTEIDEKTRTVQARCEVDNPLPPLRRKLAVDGLRGLRANLYGTARIRVAHHAAAVVVPDSAIQRMPDLATIVFVRQRDGTRFQPRKVQLGLRQNGVTQVISGVRPGEQVVTRGSFVLKSELLKAGLTGG